MYSWEMSDSNQRHPLCKSGATTAELISRCLCLGIEPSFQVRCPPVLTNRLPEEASDGDRTRDKSLEGSHVTATPHSR